jgi:hypothetical protein
MTKNKHEITLRPFHLVVHDSNSYPLQNETQMNDSVFYYLCCLSINVHTSDDGTLICSPVGRPTVVNSLIALSLAIIQVRLFDS